ncbi:unnamed protein product [Owenia fusiformis]|uniref:Uncharacterized protein n=1 Tax=Owenia fusiformis TaxID=6347 RepID=A0A8S4Q7B4_OWEFU|nr:unnamed protein product [Owenia fusiformis]
MTCKACKIETNDVVKHAVLECQAVISLRDNLFERIVDILDPIDSVALFNAEDNILIEALLEAHVLQNCKQEIWEQYISYCAIKISNLVQYLTQFNS